MEEYHSFMTCILRPVDDINAVRWQRTITKVLANVQVINFRMNKDGTVEISGTVFPNEFLKILRKARKKVELCHFQFGECSSNLFLPHRAVDYGISNKYGGPNYMFSSLIGQLGQKETEPAGYYGGRDGRFLHYGDKPSQSKKSKDSSKEKTHHDHDHNHNHVHGRDHNHNHNHVHERDQNHKHVHGRDHNHKHVHGPDQSHNHRHNHVYGHDHNHNHVHGLDHNHYKYNHVHGRDHNHSHNYNHGHDKDEDCRNRDQLLHVDGGKGKHVEWEKHEKKLEHVAGCINATPRTKVQLDCEKHDKQMKGRAVPLHSQGVNSCCLM